MATRHARVRGLLAAHAVGALEDAETAVVEEHVTECDPCRDELHQLQEAASSALAPHGDPPDAGWSRVARALRRPDGQQGDEAATG